MQTQQVPALCLYEPEKFDSTCAKFMKFTIKLALIFLSNLVRYYMYTTKITYTASHLSSLVADRFKLHLNKATSEISFTTYEVFVRALKNAYDDPDICVMAKRNLHNLKQGDRDYSVYYIEFSTYATILNYDDRIKISFFSNRAKEGLKIALSYQASLPETFDQFVQLCIKLDNRAKLLYYQSSCYAPQNTPAPWHTLSTITSIAAGPIDIL